MSIWQGGATFERGALFEQNILYWHLQLQEVQSHSQAMEGKTRGSTRGPGDEAIVSPDHTIGN